MEKRKYIISVMPADGNEHNKTYHEAVTWSHANLNHSNVLQLDLKDIYAMQGVWDVVNEVNNSMIGPYEDDSVEVQSSKVIILDTLRKLHEQEGNEDKMKLLERIIELFELSIITNRSMYFLF